MKNQKKRIGIDARLIMQTGVGRYIRNLLEHLPHEKDTEIIAYVLHDDLKEVRKRYSKITVKEANFMWHSLSEQTGFYALLMKENLDLMHFTYFSYPIMYKRPFVITIHDLTPLKFVTGKASTKNSLVYSIKHSAYKLALNSAVKNSTAIITPTETVRQEMIEEFGPRIEDKLYVTYEGVGTKLLNTEPSKKPFPHISKPFFLYVGNFYPHKNVEKLIEAFARLHEDVQLVLVGPEDHFSAHITDEIIKHGQRERIVQYHNVDNADLVYLYTKAEALIQPSKAEGFGLQLLEASYFKCPVIASNIPIFNETMGESFIPFDPNDIFDIATKLSNFLKNPKKAYLSKKEIDKRFSFKRMAQQTYDIYTDILTT